MATAKPLLGIVLLLLGFFGLAGLIPLEDTARLAASAVLIIAGFVALWKFR